VNASLSKPQSDIVLERVMRLHPKVIDLELTRVQRLLNLTGNPEKKLPPVVHVAGTNGKGSVIAYLRAILEAAGQRVHVYTSPHLVRFHERIRLAGELIEEQVLVDLIEECERANGDDPITFFEITTVAAFLAFTRSPADILLLETGLGGEFDATNVIDAPLAAIITSISFDHMQFLGETLTKIAGAKAGILKAGRPGIIGPQPPEAAEVIRRRAEAVGAPLWRHGVEWTFEERKDGEEREDGFRYRDADGEVALPKPALPGRHQFANAATAIAATRRLRDFGIADRHCAEGLSNAVWPARMQRLVSGPLVDRLPTEWELWLDGGHNADAGAVIAGMIEEWQAKERKPISLIFGMLTTKEPLAFLRHLAPHAEDLSAVGIPGDHASLAIADAVGFARQAGLPADGYDSTDAALAAIIAKHGAAPRRVLICGSLYLAGTVLAANG
jgi:dihydrofolate synthase / folylpolyglutamate synthase